MMKNGLKWLGVVVFGMAFLAVQMPKSQEEPAHMALVLNEVGDILKIDLNKGEILARTYIPDAYYSNKVGGDPKGTYVFVNGGAQLMLFLDPRSLKIQGELKTEIPRRPWESDALFEERQTGFSSFYGGKWAITPDGGKIYFSGEVPELRSTVVIDPSTYEIKSRIKDFLVYPHAVFSRDGKLMFINHRKTREIVAVDTRSDRIVKRISPPPEYDDFRGKLYPDSTSEGLLLVTLCSTDQGRKCLVRVDVNKGSVTRIMEDPFKGKSGSYAISSGGRYFGYSEYVSVQKEPAESYPNTFERIYTGKINIVNLETQQRKVLSLQEKYPADKWNLSVKPYMVPNTEKMLLPVVRRLGGDWNPKLMSRKLPRPWHLLVIDLPTATVERTVEIPDGGFRDLTFLPTD